jgi:hypothetical protein
MRSDVSTWWIVLSIRFIDDRIAIRALFNSHEVVRIARTVENCDPGHE